jgi:hypothetical protein
MAWLRLSASSVGILATGAAFLGCNASNGLPPTASESFRVDSGRVRGTGGDAFADTEPDGPEEEETPDAFVPAPVDAAALGDANPCVLQSATAAASAAKSTGYSGTWEAYGTLSSVPCSIASDCVASCAAAGGTDASCSTASRCVLAACGDGGAACSMCLPPSYWLDVNGALGAPDSGAALLGAPADDLQQAGGGYSDTLEVTGFGLSIPSGASILGIAFQVDRSASDDQATDESVKVLKGGAAVGVDHAQSQPWPLGVFAPITYGGSNDTWGVAWTSNDINQSEFGIAITPHGLSEASSDHVYVDSVEASVVYLPPGCP